MQYLRMGTWAHGHMGIFRIPIALPWTVCETNLFAAVESSGAELSPNIIR